MLNSQPRKSAEDIAFSKIRGNGGSFTIDFRQDDVQPTLVKTLNKMKDKGLVTKSVSPDGLVHTFVLR